MESPEVLLSLNPSSARKGSELLIASAALRMMLTLCGILFPASESQERLALMG